MLRFVKIVTFTTCLFLSSTSFSTEDRQDNNSQPPNNVIVEKRQEEKIVLKNNFVITLYKPNYILPYYYTGSPYNAAYVNETPNGEKLNRSEVKYQLSFKVPIWDNIFHSSTSLYFGYTQLSYWQLYDNHPFFRSTDYEPEFFTQTELNKHLGGKWYLNTIKLGGVHQSNGFGNQMERSWNRIYLEASFSNEHALVRLRPWYIFHDSSYQEHNPNIGKYLGYGEIILAYKFGRQVISIQTHSLIECGGRYATGMLTYSFPLINNINGFIEIFSGYGQSLIEYNHRTNSAGIGFTLNNYI